MKDIAPKALELGMGEAVKLLEKQVERGKLTTGKMAQVLAGITPTLSFGDFGAVDIVVEAVVENEKVKKKVLAELEASVQPGHDPRVEHLDHLDHAARRGPEGARRASAGCTSSTRSRACRSSR